MSSKTVLNMTQHPASPEQVEVGVYNPDDAAGRVIRNLLTFEEVPSSKEVESRAVGLAAIASKLGVKSVMIGGAPYLMAHLERALDAQGIQPLYAFSRRESVETVAPDGATVKRSVFRHVGFVPAG